MLTKVLLQILFFYFLCIEHLFLLVNKLVLFNRKNCPWWISISRRTKNKGPYYLYLIKTKIHYNLFIHLFIQLIFTKGILSVRYSSKYWKYSSEQNPDFSRVFFFLIEENPLIIIYVHADRHIEMHKWMLQRKTEKGMGSAEDKICSCKLGWSGRASGERTFE